MWRQLLAVPIATSITSPSSTKRVRFKEEEEGVDDARPRKGLGDIRTA